MKLTGLSWFLRKRFPNASTEDGLQKCMRINTAKEFPIKQKEQTKRNNNNKKRRQQQQQQQTIESKTFFFHFPAISYGMRFSVRLIVYKRKLIMIKELSKKVLINLKNIIGQTK